MRPHGKSGPDPDALETAAWLCKNTEKFRQSKSTRRKRLINGQVSVCPPVCPVETYTTRVLADYYKSVKGQTNRDRQTERQSCDLSRHRSWMNHANWLERSMSWWSLNAFNITRRSSTDPLDHSESNARLPYLLHAISTYTDYTYTAAVPARHEPHWVYDLLTQQGVYKSSLTKFQQINQSIHQYYTDDAR